MTVAHQDLRRAYPALARLVEIEAELDADTSTDLSVSDTRLDRAYDAGDPLPDSFRSTRNRLATIALAMTIAAVVGGVATIVVRLIL